MINPKVKEAIALFKSKYNTSIMDTMTDNVAYREAWCGSTHTDKMCPFIRRTIVERLRNPVERLIESRLHSPIRAKHLEMMKNGK